MLAFCNGAIVKILLVLTGFVSGDTCPSAPHGSAVGTSVVAVRVSATADTAASRKGRAPSAKPEKPSKEEAPSRITITDEGIQIESGGSDKVILDINGKNVGQIGARIGDKLENLPESLNAVFEEAEDKRFYHVKGSDLVQLGKRIVVGSDEIVNGDVVAIFSDIDIEGKVTGDVAAIFGSVSIGSEGIVNGEVVSILGEVNRKAGSIVRGETAVIGRHHRSGLTFPIGPFGEGMFGAGAKVVLFIITILLMLIVMYFLAQRMTNASSHASGSFAKSFGVGLLVLIAGTVLVAVLSIILAITIVGIPVAVLLVLSFVALFVLGYFVSSLAIGSFVARKCNMEWDSVYVRTFIGIFILSIFGIIAAFLFFNPWMGPARVMLRVVGGLLNFVAVMTGVGAFIVSKGGSFPKTAEGAVGE
jgi:preprotein translocase subunit YajC